MIVHPAKHFFESKFPTLEDHEEEIFFHHPLYNIKCNQIGVLYYDEEVFVLYQNCKGNTIKNKEISKTIGSKTKVAWECYHGEILAGTHFLYVNGNVLDARKENLMAPSKLSKQELAKLSKVKKNYCLASAIYLKKIESRMEKVGIGKEELYDLLVLPNWLKMMRKKLDFLG